MSKNNGKKRKELRKERADARSKATAPRNCGHNHTAHGYILCQQR